MSIVKYIFTTYFIIDDNELHMFEDDSIKICLSEKYINGYS